jgi:hypothetical protein
MSHPDRNNSDSEDLSETKLEMMHVSYVLGVPSADELVRG